jgi:serine/threonine-protein kinase
LTGTVARASVRSPERDIPPELDAICVQSTAVERRERFASARQLGDVVQRFLDGNRDVAMRKELALAEHVAAQSALAAGNRRDALRAAARSLALDPTARDAAELVGRLMLEPPKEMPPEVQTELDQLDLVNLEVSARFGMFAAIAYLAFFPLLYWVGFRELWYHAVGVGICIVIIYAEAKIAPRDAFLSGYIAITGNLLVFALFSWMVSPVVLGPGPGTVIVMLMATHRKLIRPGVLAVLTVLAITSPWLLAQFGLAPPMPSIEGSTIALHTVAGDLGHVPTLIALGIYLVALIGLAAFLGHLQENDRIGVRRRLQLQSWQLRQLVTD